MNKELYRIIDYTPENEMLFEQAITHSSCACGYDYERLEFLGDAVLELISSEWLYKMFPEMQEGELTKLRSELVCENGLYSWTKTNRFADCIRLGKGEELSGGRHKPSILSDSVEAVIAAIYLDAGLEEARAFTESMLEYLLKLQIKGMLVSDAKTALQELLQAEGKPLPVYELTGKDGPEHSVVFHVRVSCEGGITAEGTGNNKKHAEQNAAREALMLIKANSRKQ